MFTKMCGIKLNARKIFLKKFYSILLSHIFLKINKSVLVLGKIALIMKMKCLYRRALILPANRSILNV